MDLIDGQNFKISIAGVEHEIIGGLKPSEFSKLTIESKDESIKIESFEITLARGNRSVSVSNIQSNNFDLRDFIGKARSGDVIVIQINTLVDKEGKQFPDNSVISIEVK